MAGSREGFCLLPFFFKGMLIFVLRELNVYVQKRNSHWRGGLIKVSGKGELQSEEVLSKVIRQYFIFQISRVEKNAVLQVVFTNR